MKGLSIYWFLLLGVSIGCQDSSQAAEAEQALIKVSIYYANAAENTFDHGYYAQNHMPMLADLFGEKMIRYEIDRGMSGRTSEEVPSFLAVGHLYFLQLSDYQEAFGQHAEQILSDIPNYTNVQPTVQVSQVVHQTQ